MNKIDSTLRLFADMVAGIFGQVYSDSHKNQAPLWAVVGMVIMGIIAVALLGLAAYVLLI